ncbi:hypothetical protein [Deinococcus frigens]|uniref:hypothetical protein n=1 Tax=Deinococcus frigens TaxID=249403 RepID=UPI00054D4A88|nr:hypothetical protein [Deinococcus frigens]
MPWINVFMLLVVALLVGWVPVLGPLLLGFLAGRVAPGVWSLGVLLPALAVQTSVLLAARWVAQGVAASSAEGWLWTALTWLSGPLSVALGRPLGAAVGGSDPLGFLLLFTLPVLPGLVLGIRSARR